MNLLNIEKVYESFQSFAGGTVVREHAGAGIVYVEDIHEYLKQSEKYNNILPAMEDYMAKYCIL